jgi:hypothetical protein
MSSDSVRRPWRKGPVPQPLGPRFWALVGEPDPNGCRLWLGPTHTRGYGYVGLPRQPKRAQRMVLAHRVAWALTFGPIPVGYDVLHRCPGGGTRLCCEPDHLYLGTDSDNLKDAYHWGRRPRLRPGHQKRLS